MTNGLIPKSMAICVSGPDKAPQAASGVKTKLTKKPTSHTIATTPTEETPAKSGEMVCEISAPTPRAADTLPIQRQDPTNRTIEKLTLRTV